MPASYPQALKVLEAQFGKTAFGTQTAYVGLSSTTPANGSPPTNITEPSTGSYARVATTGATWGAAAVLSTTPTIKNAASITFPTATADWLSAAVLTYAIVYDALTGGNVIGYAPLTVAKNCPSGDTFSIGVGNLVVTLV